MPGIARVGDVLGAGGLLTAPFSPDVTVNGRPVALLGCVYTPHAPCSPKKPQHCFGVTLDAPYGVTVNGMIPITKTGRGTCGDSVKTASQDVQIVGGLLGTAIGLGSAAAGFL